MLNNCETGERSRDLYVTSQALQEIRQSEDCRDLYSVEQCVGFQNTQYTRVLKSMEKDFRCAGYCYTPPLYKAAEPNGCCRTPTGGYGAYQSPTYDETPESCQIK